LCPCGGEPPNRASGHGERDEGAGREPLADVAVARGDLGVELPLERANAGPTLRGGPASAGVGSVQAGHQQHLAGVPGEEVDGFVDLAERHAVGDEPLEVESAGVE
jgi:hypothetical protein